VAPSGKLKKSSSGKQSTLTGDVMREKKQKKKKGPDERPSVKKPDTKKLVDTSDPSFDSASEGVGSRKEGESSGQYVRSTDGTSLNLSLIV
jgi:hypothetical protein